MVCLALELVGSWVELSLSVGMEVQPLSPHPRELLEPSYKVPAQSSPKSMQGAY